MANELSALEREIARRFGIPEKDFVAQKAREQTAAAELTRPVSNAAIDTVRRGVGIAEDAFIAAWNKEQTPKSGK